MKPSVLVVDDEHVFRVLAEEALASEGFEVRVAGTLAQARTQLERALPDLVVLDRRLPDGDGLTFLRNLRTEDSSAPLFVVVTAYGDIANAVDALHAGAVDYLAKPVQPTDLVLKLRKALEVRGLRERLALARRSRAPLVAPASARMRSVVETLRSVSRSPLTPVFLSGASGSGKQHAAELLHGMTYPPTESEAPFVDVNCAALPNELVDSELFGHERGAFTDAKSSRRGLIEKAHGGTLFLDEIAELPDASQAKLLKFLDSMRFRRVGGEREFDVALRVIAATNQNLNELMRRGRFREDLYHRLTVFLVEIPPLAERREEIPELARAFVGHFAGRVKKRVEGLSDSALALLMAYDFPGNVRELRNVIERAVILAQRPVISDDDIILPSGPRATSDIPAFFSVQLPPNGPPSVHDVERAYLTRVLDHMGGRRVAAAHVLGISYPTFLRRLRELGLPDA